MKRLMILASLLFVWAVSAQAVLDVISLQYESVPTNASAQSYVTNTTPYIGYVEAVSIEVTNITPAVYVSGATNNELSAYCVGYYTVYDVSGGTNLYRKMDGSMYIWEANRTNYISDEAFVVTNIAFWCATNHGGSIIGTNYVAAGAIAALEEELVVCATAQYCTADVDIQAIADPDATPIQMDVYNQDTVRAAYCLPRTNPVTIAASGQAFTGTPTRLFLYNTRLRMAAYEGLWTGAVVKAKVYINTGE